MKVYLFPLKLKKKGFKKLVELLLVSSCPTFYGITDTS